MACRMGEAPASSGRPIPVPAAAAAPADVARKERRLRPSRDLLRFMALGRTKVERDGVHAVALTGGRWAIVEHVAEMRSTSPAQHFGPQHPMGGVFNQLYVLPIHRIVEAGPARARLKLGGGAEERGPTGRAAIRAVVLGVYVATGERPLRPLFAQNRVLFGRETAAPLLLGHLGRFFRGHRYIPPTVVAPACSEGCRREPTAESVKSDAPRLCVVGCGRPKPADGLELRGEP